MTSTQKLSNQYLEIEALNQGLAQKDLKLDKRIQVKIPAKILKQLDTLFPNQDRSRVLSRLAADAILQKLRFIDRLDLATLSADEQSGLDDMYDYLEKRDDRTQNR